jgi:ssDNA-binding Zn-finger/Zn-ribbon topoisomerase 1
MARTETSQSQLTPGPYGKIEDISTYSSYFYMKIGGRRCHLDPLTEIRINGLLLDLEKGNTTQTAMKKLSRIFNHNTLKEISCISIATIPVPNRAPEYIKEINLDVPEYLRIGAFGMFKLCSSYPEKYYIFKDEPSSRVHLDTGRLYFRNEETMEFIHYRGIADMTPIDVGVKNIIYNEETMVEETTMIHKRKSLSIKNIIFNAPATIVFWDDNTKTIVKCGEGDVFDPEKGVAMAVMKRALGTNETDSNYLDKVKKYLDRYKED